MDLFEKIKNAHDIEMTYVFVPEWDCGVCLKPLTVDEALKYAELEQSENTLVNLFAYIACDEDGKQIFDTKEKCDVLRKKNFKIVTRLLNEFNKANELNVDDAKKN